jgi:RNA polymerase sigma factor (TIGR02999 family)
MPHIWGDTEQEMPTMGDVTLILSQIEDGDDQAAERLLPLVYEELRKLAATQMAHEKPGQTLQATGLVHEAYLRLVGNAPASHWQGRGHFFSAAAEAMRRILVERARLKATQKAGGDWKRVDFEHLDPINSVTPAQFLMMDEAITRLDDEDPLAGQLVRLRYFSGLSVKEAADVLGIATTTAYDHWAFARAFLRCELLDNTN